MIFYGILNGIALMIEVVWIGSGKPNWVKEWFLGEKVLKEGEKKVRWA